MEGGIVRLPPRSTGKPGFIARPYCPQQIAELSGVSLGTVANVRRRFAAGGLDAALNDRPRPGAVPVLDGKAEAIIIATACSPVPEGRATWTARLLANRLVEI